MRRAGFLSVMGLAACPAVFGCATPNSVTYAAINSPPRPFVQRDAAAVDVFVGKTPARPYVEVGLFEVYQGMGDDGLRRSTEDMIDTLRFHAGLRGCDAVQVLGVELAGKHEWRVVRGVCEVYTDEQAEQAAVHITRRKLLPGEGKSCEPIGTGPTVTPATCPDPLVCSDKLCVSPYH